MITHVAIIIDGEVQSLPKPNRHHDIIRLFPLWNHRQGEQGFIDDKHGFVNRKAAFKIADMQGQLDGRKLVAEAHGLFSEDLW